MGARMGDMHRAGQVASDRPGEVEQLVRVVAPHFVAGLVMQGDRCTHAAPILGWAVGRRRKTLQAAFARQGWTASVIP
jgi:hypothetical protein